MNEFGSRSIKRKFQLIIENISMEIHLFIKSPKDLY